jgi:predicted GNAT family acetyltransferase
MNLLRSYVQGLLAEEPLGIHGAGMTEKELLSRLGFGGIEIEKGGTVTDDEADRIAKKIAELDPERIYAYSRGAAALNKAMLDDDMPADMPPVTYVAPAALRGWTDASVPDLPAGSVTVIGDRDGAVPVKQACDIAKQANTPLYVHPDRSHAGVLYTKGQTDGAYAVDIDACLADDDLPDWGTGKKASRDELAIQQRRSPELAHEGILRECIRLLVEQAHAQEVTYDKYGRPDPTPSDFAFMKEYKSLSKENPMGFPDDRYWYMGEIDGKHCLVMTNIYIDLNRGGIYFNSIQTVPPDVCEGQGFASKVMNKITALADKHGVSLRLMAAAFGQKSVTDEDLISWYKRAGFEQKDPDYSEVLMRQPR